MIRFSSPLGSSPRTASALFATLVALVLGVSCQTVVPLRVPGEPEVRFDAARSAELETRTVLGSDGAGLTLVRPEIEGRELGWFLLDSGSANLLISKRDADGLGLPTVAEGFAERGLPVTYHLARRFRLGPMSLRDTLVAAVDWSHAQPLERALGTELAGLVGYQVFAHAVVELRYGDEGAHDRVALHDPESFELPAGSWYPLRVIDRRPVVPVRLVLPGTPDDAPREIQVIIDTGTAGALVLDPDFAAETGLVGPRPETGESEGSEPLQLAARVRSLGTAAPWLEVAGLRLESVPITLRPTPLGVRRVLAGIDAIIGRQLFRGRTLILDYPNRRMAVLPGR